MKNSDMAILIIGGKYGSPSTTDNNEFEEYVSVTRKEFRSANESKIPIYTFVDSKVFTEYELYERNINESEAILNIKFNNADNINIFKFINEIKILGLPMFQFLTINDIEHILNEQWADLMKNISPSFVNRKRQKRRKIYWKSWRTLLAELIIRSL